MFDIGFWELVVIGVVALLVFGPEEFPVMVRNVMGTLRGVRRMLGNVRADLTHEINKAEELKQLVAREIEVAKLHETINDEQLTVPVKGRSLPDAVAPQQSNDSSPQGPIQEVAPSDTGGPNHGHKQ